MPPAKPPTLKRIAELAQVSPSVVSAVLSGHQGTIRCSAETAERIRATAERLHYRPSRIARSLQANAHFAIGLLVSRLYYLPHMYLHWLSLALGARNRVLIIQSLPDPGGQASCQMLEQRFVDAAVCAEHPDPAILDRCTEIGLPMLFINADPDHPGARILFDEALAMDAIHDHLAGQGYARVLLDDHGGDGYWVAERRRAAAAAARRLGLPPTERLPATATLADTADRLAAACTPGTAVIVLDNQLLPFLHRRLSDRGLRIPEDVGLTAYGSPAPADLTWTTVHIETRLLADQSADLLIAPDGLSDRTRLRVPYIFTPGASTARRGG